MKTHIEQIAGLDLVRDGDVVGLLDGRRRVGMVDGAGGEFAAWVYLFDRRTGITAARYIGCAANLDAAVALVVGERPGRIAW